MMGVFWLPSSPLTAVPRAVAAQGAAEVVRICWISGVSRWRMLDPSSSPSTTQFCAKRDFLAFAEYPRFCGGE
jgi:hypothetical protein